MAGIKIIRDISTIGGADIFGTVMSAVFWFYLASQIEPSSYGEIGWFLGIAGLFSGIALFGTANTITVYTAKKTQIQSTLNFISLSASVILSFIVIVLFPSFYTIDVGIILIAYVINTLAIGDLLGRKQYTNYSKYTLVQKGLTLGLGVSFFYLFGYEAIIFALALSYLLHFKRIFSIFKEMRINFSLIKPRIGFIGNNYFMSILAVTSGQVDKIVVAPLLGFAILGNYSLAVQVVSVMLILPNVFQKYLLPQESTGVKNRKPKILVIIFSVLITILGIFVAPILINEFFPKFTEAVDAIKIMSIVVIPTTISLIIESEFLGKEKSRIVLVGTAILVTSLIIGMIILGSLMGIEGVAYSLVIAQTAKLCFYLIAKRVT
jgi:O-antigen/teichoic acid export membrane protein